MKNVILVDIVFDVKIFFDNVLKHDENNFLRTH
jgi:hypothetical protein